MLAAAFVCVCMEVRYDGRGSWGGGGGSWYDLSLTDGVDGAWHETLLVTFAAAQQKFSSWLSALLPSSQQASRAVGGRDWCRGRCSCAEVSAAGSAPMLKLKSFYCTKGQI